MNFGVSGSPEHTLVLDINDFDETAPGSGNGTSSGLALVGQRNRLRASERPRRFLEDTRVVAREAGVLRNRVRVLDSTPIYDAVSTQDTVTQLRSAIRKLLRAVNLSVLEVAARAVLCRDVVS